MSGPAPSPASTPAHRPRGGALLLAAVLLTACAMRAPLTGVGPVLGEVAAGTGLGSTASGVLTSLPLLAFAAASAAVPRAAGRLGVRPALLLALLVLVAGAGVRWLPGPVPLFAGTALLGVAIAVANVLLPGVVRAGFRARAAVAASAYLVLMQLAGGLAAGSAVPLAERLPGGWRTALVVWALPALAAALLWVPLARSRTGAAAGPRARAPWRSPLAWAVTVHMGAQSLVFYSLLAWLPTLLRERSGLGATEAGWQLTLLQASGVLASLLVPALVGGSGSDARRSRRATVGAALLEVAGVVLLLGATGAAAGVLVPVAVVLVGAGGGAALVLALAATSERAADAAGAVALSGMAQSVGYLLAAAGPVLVGAAHAASGSWVPPLLLVGALALVQLAAGRRAGAGGVVRAG
ncbi:MFS transporter [Kineococcus gypseus]|uniref:MFS transporter n=1 Tax=Kineococcus gypseus TaxID=1637102 RepID=UPI003D7DF8E5